MQRNSFQTRKKRPLQHRNMSAVHRTQLQQQETTNKAYVSLSSTHFGSISQSTRITLESAKLRQATCNGTLPKALSFSTSPSGYNVANISMNEEGGRNAHAAWIGRASPSYLPPYRRSMGCQVWANVGLDWRNSVARDQSSFRRRLWSCIMELGSLFRLPWGFWRNRVQY